MRGAVESFMKLEMNLLPLWSARSIYSMLRWMDVYELLNGSWLSDNMIDAFIQKLKRKCASGIAWIVPLWFMSMVVDEGDRSEHKWGRPTTYAHAYNTFVEEPLLKRHGSILFPICNHEHWHLLVLDLIRKEFRHYSSVPLVNDSLTCAWVWGAQTVMKYIGKHGKSTFDAYGGFKKFKYKICDCPRQTNGSDCGMYVYFFMKSIIEGTPVEHSLIGHTPEDWRMFLAVEILLEGSEEDPAHNSQLDESQLLQLHSQEEETFEEDACGV